MMHIPRLKTFFYGLWRGLIFSAAIGVTLASPLSAQDFPTHAIRFVVPQAPGGASDVVSRLVGQKLLERWGQPIVVDNRSGAGGRPRAMNRVPACGMKASASRDARR